MKVFALCWIPIGQQSVIYQEIKSKTFAIKAAHQYVQSYL